MSIATYPVSTEAPAVPWWPGCWLDSRCWPGSPAGPLGHLDRGGLPGPRRVWSTVSAVTPTFGFSPVSALWMLCLHFCRMVVAGGERTLKGAWPTWQAHSVYRSGLRSASHLGSSVLLPSRRGHASSTAFVCGQQ